MQNRHSVWRKRCIGIAAAASYALQVRAVGAGGGEFHVVVSLFPNVAFRFGGFVPGLVGFGEMGGVEEDSGIIRRPHRMNVLTDTGRELMIAGSVRVHNKNMRCTFVDRHECDFLAVGRPGWGIVLIRTASDLPHITPVARVAGIEDMYSHAAVAVRNENDTSPVGRPRCLVVDDVREERNAFEREVFCGSENKSSAKQECSCEWPQKRAHGYF